MLDILCARNVKDVAKGGESGQHVSKASGRVGSCLECWWFVVVLSQKLVSFSHGPLKL